ncbi:MAG: PqiC family protein [Cephaloticoccus sp.]|nr:PqiC family protein [Cephaloticoccus sp.]MCF7760298.1 PqiC family protein [Cephaloticoccus sp.]
MNDPCTAKWKLAAVGLVLALAGCSVIPEPQADLTRYYVLNGPAVAVDQTHEGALQVGLRAVQLAPYLDKGTVVMRTGPNELIYNDYARWAEPLGAAITRVVQSRLLASPRVNRVLNFPFPFDQPRDYDVSLNILRCGGVRTDDQTAVEFSVLVEISRPGEKSAVISRQVFTADAQNWDGRDYGELVQRLSADVARLGDAVVAALPAN